MAIIKRGILGGLSGKIGNVVGSSWKGIATLKSLPLSVSNPKTVGQVAQRKAFKAVTLAGSDLLSDICKPLWDREAQQMSGYNAFVKNNIKAFSSLGILTVADFKPTLGIEDAQVIAEVVIANDSANVVLDWTAGALVGKQATTDEMQAVVFNETQKVFASVSGSVTRDDEEITVVMPANSVTGDVISVWLCARDASHTVFFAAGSELSSTVQ